MTPTALARLDDGRQILVRPIEPGDTARLMDLHRRLSAETVRRRFFLYVPELDPQRAEAFTHLDGHDCAAVVAEDEHGDLVAVVRYSRVPGERDADIAAVVRDDYQHHGIGTALLALLALHAVEEGVERFIADVLTDNLAMLRTCRDAGLTGTVAYDAGVAHLELPLVPA